MISIRLSESATELPCSRLVSETRHRSTCSTRLSRCSRHCAGELRWDAIVTHLQSVGETVPKSRPEYGKLVFMSREFKTADYEATVNQTISIREALPADHLARFVVDLVAQLDLGRLYERFAPYGGIAYAPEILLALLF